MSSGTRAWTFGVVAAAALLAGSVARTAIAEGIKAGDDAPPVSSADWVNVKPDEKPSAARLRGRVVMIEFWGTWCSARRDRAPSSSRTAQHGLLEGIHRLTPERRVVLAAGLVELLRAMDLEQGPAPMMFEDDARPSRARGRRSTRSR